MIETIKQKLNETKKTIKTEYKRLKRNKKVRYYLTIIFLIALLLMVGKANANNLSRIDNLETRLEQQTQETKEVETRREQEKRDLEKRVKDLEARKAEKARLASIKPVVTKRVSMPRVSGNCEQYRPLIAKYNWNVNTMIAICNAESSGVATKSNWTDNHGVCKGSHGLFQISCDRGVLYDPAANIAAAWSKYIGAKNNPKTGYWGYWPWSVCKNGRVRCI